nr:NAD-dependent epimerase/dehydratase family protein [uncultured Mucilaginibacter sp.]
MKTIAITGAWGFVGQNLMSYLRNEQLQLQALLRSQLQSDIISFDEGCEVIVHLAGKAHDLKNTSEPDEYYKVNFQLTQKLYDAFLQSNAKKFIYISSVKAAADSLDNKLDEDVVPNPATHYGKSKLMAEKYIQSQPLPEGKAYYILRPCMIHGPGNKGNLNQLYHFVKKGIPYPLAGFNNQRSFLTVQNLCFIINELIKSADTPVGIYNVADDEPMSTNKVIQILSESVQRKPKLWAISPSLIKLIAKAGDWLHLPLNTERLKKMTEDYVVDNNKIKKALGKALPLTTAQGLLLTAKSFKI